MSYVSLSTGYHELKVYSIICRSNTLVSKYFVNSMFRFLDDYQLLLKVDMGKPDDLFSILNQIKNNIQFTVEKT